MKNQTEINGITYNILAEVYFNVNSNIMTNYTHNYVSSLTLVRPKGNKKFDAMRNSDGKITLN